MTSALTNIDPAIVFLVPILFTLSWLCSKRSHEFPIYFYLSHLFFMAGVILMFAFFAFAFS